MSLSTFGSKAKSNPRIISIITLNTKTHENGAKIRKNNKYHLGVKLSHILSVLKLTLILTRLHCSSERESSVVGGASQWGAKQIEAFVYCLFEGSNNLYQFLSPTVGTALWHSLAWMTAVIKPEFYSTTAGNHTTEPSHNFFTVTYYRVFYGAQQCHRCRYKARFFVRSSVSACQSASRRMLQADLWQAEVADGGWVRCWISAKAHHKQHSKHNNNTLCFHTVRERKQELCTQALHCLF